MWEGLNPNINVSTEVWFSMEQYWSSPEVCVPNNYISNSWWISSFTASTVWCSSCSQPVWQKDHWVCKKSAHCLKLLLFICFWGRGGEGASGHFCTFTGNLRRTLAPAKSSPTPDTRPPLNTHWTSQVPEWVWLHLGEKLQLIFKQRLSASKLITDLQSVSCKLKSQMGCWQRDVTNAMKRLKVLGNRRNV